MGERNGQAADATSAVRTVATPAGSGMILQRERVHALIDARLPGAIWLHGPTGAGKTVALRTYLERSGLQAFWVSLDERHREPAALFASITATFGMRASLPTFSPEHRDDPQAFARDYFGRVVDAMHERQAFVVDDLHLAEEASALLVEAIDVFGNARRLFFASQLRPNPRFASHLAGSRLWTLGHRHLAFDRREAEDLATRLGGHLPAIDVLLAATDGWAAGLMLAMQLGPPSSDDTGDPLGSLRNPLAHLIAAQVLQGVAPHEFRRLRVLADLPQVPMSLTDVAHEWQGACAHLDRLADRGLFVERIASDRLQSDGSAARIRKGSFRLHDLFRTALREAGSERLVDAALARELVSLLVRLERLDLAWQLASTGSIDVLDDLIDTHGPDALRDPGLPLMREATAHDRSASPSVSYWRARALLGSDERAALASAEAAWVGYDARADASRKGLAASLALFAAFTSVENVSAIRLWSERFLDVSRDDALRAATRDEQAIRCAAEVMHDMYFGTRVSGADAGEMQDRLLGHIVSDVLPPDESVLAGSMLVASMERANRLAEAEAAIVRIESLPVFAAAAPHIRAAWALESGYHQVRVGAPAIARRAFDRALTIANENALPRTMVGALIGLVRIELMTNRIPEARALCERIESTGSDLAGIQGAQVFDLRGRVELAANDPQRALHFNDAALELIREQDLPPAATRMFQMCRVEILHALGRHDESGALGERLVDESPVDDRERIRVTVLLLEADRRWAVEREDAVRALREAFESAARLNVVNFVPLSAHVASSAASRALRLSLVPDFVKQAIRVRGLPAPADASPEWPWPVRIRVLGTFAILQDGVPMVFVGKAQQKPLELLKFLACERAMTSDARALMSALWPDADGDGGRKNLEVTVSRLRKLLGDDTLVVVKEGRVALDATRVSSDAREFIEQCAACETAMAQPATRGRARELAASLLAIFSGLPLEHDEGLTWRDGTRERFRNALVRAVRSLAAHLEDVGDSAEAIALLETAIAREPLAEGLCQMLMRAYVRTGEHAEAMRVYRHCRQMLSVLIGATPSAETERIKDSIHPPGESR